MGDLSDFERVHIFGVHLAGVYVTKTDTLLGVLRVSSKGYVGIPKSWKDNITKEEQWVKINIDRKSLSYIEKYCFKKSHNCCSMGNSRTD
jgi:hypothetical protein